jgi:hypothetical protein
MIRERRNGAPNREAKARSELNGGALNERGKREVLL